MGKYLTCAFYNEISYEWQKKMLTLDYANQCIAVDFEWSLNSCGFM